MENASKALVMAGSVLLTMLVVSLLLYAWTTYSEFQESQDMAKDIENITKFNLQFTNYNREDVQGYELISLVNKVIDYNQRYSSGFDESSTVGNSAAYSPITVNIKLDDDGRTTNRDKLTTTITVPAVAKTNGKDKAYSTIKNNLTFSNPIEKTYNGNTNRLFINEKYIQSNASNEFETILSEISGIETDFKGTSKAQDLVKSISTIFEGKIIEYNGQPEDNTERRSWFNQSYIKSRYKTLTGKNETDIKNIRSAENVMKILKYHEYIEFKKAEFKCTGITYNQSTGRVASLSFEMK